MRNSPGNEAETIVDKIVALKALIVFVKEGASDVDIELWEKMKVTVGGTGTPFLEVRDQEERNNQSQALENEGWHLQGIGKGMFDRISLYYKL